MKKECHYCGNGFNAKRADAKYCSATCKQEAYLMRKANPTINNAAQSSSLNGNNNSGSHVNRRHNRQGVKTPISLSGTQFDKLLTGQRTNHEMLNFLLSEKDSNGDMKSENSKLEIKLMFLERDLKNAESQIHSLESENRELRTQNDFSSKGTFEKVLDACVQNPEAVIMGLRGLTKSNNSTPNQTSDQVSGSITDDMDGLNQISLLLDKLKDKTGLSYKEIHQVLLDNESLILAALNASK